MCRGVCLVHVGRIGPANSGSWGIRIKRGGWQRRDRYRKLADLHDDGPPPDGPAWAPLDPDFAAGKQALAANDWNGAIKALGSAALRDTRSADIQNYLGYAYRRLRQLEPAFRHYRLALTLNPRHRSAHEHLGEANLVIGNLPEAEEHLAALERICLIACEEYDDLKTAITEYRKSAMR
jgi:tetratricopeptide (TPR) repeat protein